MKRIVAMLAAAMLFMVFAGCASVRSEKKTNSAPTEAAGNAAETANESAGDAAKGTEPAAKADAKTISKAYEAYSDVKTEFLTKLTEALTQNKDTVWGSVALLPLVSVELDLIPVTLLGQGKQSIAVGLAVMGATDIEYSENGGLHSVNYSDKGGAPCSLSVTYDAGADALVCTHTKDGEENIYAQYQKTAFGYAAQYYLITEKGEARLYQLSLSGEDGMVGVSKDANKPSALTGGEVADFPKACPEWYGLAQLGVHAFVGRGVEHARYMLLRGEGIL